MTNDWSAFTKMKGAKWQGRGPAKGGNKYYWNGTVPIDGVGGAPSASTVAARTQALRRDTVSYVKQQLPCGRPAVAIFIPVIALVAACDSGPSDSEFVTACLAEGERGANKMMRREMGVKGEDFCKCGARKPDLPCRPKPGKP